MNKGLIYSRLPNTSPGIQTARGLLYPSAWSDISPVATFPVNLPPIYPGAEVEFNWRLLGKEQLAYEVQWCVPGGEWNSTGQIVSANKSHIWPANTFPENTDIIQWQVRCWINGTPTTWSKIVSFTTVASPIISGITPVADTEIATGVISFGAKVTSPYSRSVQLVAEIADNPEFTNSEIYFTAYVASGQRAEASHLIRAQGIYHVRMTAVDAEGFQSGTVYYTFSAIQVLNFKQRPQVIRKRPYATHVTVYVKDSDPLVSYTAVISPEPLPAAKIHRWVGIDAGNQAQCQQVAETLLEKWSVEQLTVQGISALIVTLQYGQYVRCYIPQQNLLTDLMLQSKQHNVDKAETHIVLGNALYMSPGEVLARVLEDLST